MLYSPTCWEGIHTRVSWALRIFSGLWIGTHFVVKGLSVDLERVIFCNFLLAIQFDGPPSSTIYVDGSDWSVK
jgi:hypothetical protein